MKDELITFSTAQLAKERGFDWDDDDTIWINKGMDKSKPATHPAPTQSLLQRWLREEHKLHIFINYTLLSFRFSLVKLDPQGIMDYSLSGKAYMCGEKKTYEEALEWALQEALKLINQK